MSKHFILFLFLVPSDSEGFLHTLIGSLSTEWALGRVWFPIILVPLLPAGMKLDMQRDPPPRCGTERH